MEYVIIYLIFSSHLELIATASVSAQTYAFGPGLLASNGASHKRQRKMLNPVFSASHVKRQAPLVHNISKELREVIVQEVIRAAGSSEEKKAVADVEVAEWLGRASLEMISQAGLGHTFRALQGEGSAYLRAVKEITCVHFPLYIFFPLLPVVYFINSLSYNLARR